jgi:hypothetical protein
MTMHPQQYQQSQPYNAAGGRPQPDSLADLLERVLDQGIIIAGDIKVDLLEIELLTIKIRLLVASVDKAQEMGIDWWRDDPMLSRKNTDLVKENRELRSRIEALESGTTASAADRSDSTSRADG